MVAALHFTGFSGQHTVGRNFCLILLQIAGCFLMVKKFKLIFDSSTIQPKKLDPDFKGRCPSTFLKLIYFLKNVTLVKALAECIYISRAL